MTNTAVLPPNSTDPHHSPNLGPGALQAQEKSPFLLSSADWYALQRYVDSALVLPTSDDTLRRSLLMSAAESVEPFRDLMAAYAAVYQHCRTWHDETFPASVNLADDIVHYNTKVPTYYGALRDALGVLRRNPTDPETKQDCLDIIADLAKDAKAYADRAKAVREGVIAFSNATAADKARLTEVDQALERQFGDSITKIKSLNEEVASAKKLLDELTAEYEHSTVVAATSPSYAWVFPFGLIAAAVVAGVYGDRAVKAKHQLDEIRTKIGTLQADLARTLRLQTLLDGANSNVDRVISLLGPALAVIQKIEGVWRALCSDFENVGKIIETIATRTEAGDRLARLDIPVAIEQWAKLGAAANNYRVHAFIDVPAPPPMTVLAA